MDVDERRRVLRGAIARGDHLTLTRFLQEEEWPPYSLQLIGDGLLWALTATEDAEPLARRCADVLRERAWPGDEDLADALDRRGQEQGLRHLPVPLDELAEILEGDPLLGGGRIDLRTGEVWPQPALEYAEEVGELADDAVWLSVECEGSRDGYHDMEAFIDTVASPDLAERLAIAIRGRGAFRRFKDTLSRRPGEMNRWHAFRDDRARGRARAWLADAGYTTAPPVEDP